jgi:diadenosine tetraphosphate (Ap4A) HIT family hydrolase
MSFQLHPRLAADSFTVGDLPLSRVLLNNDARFPWCILVPRIAGLRDLHDVPPTDRSQLFIEIERLSLALIELTQADKMNVAALGNMVPQLHVHVIGRRQDDAAWPMPVWNAGAGQPYPERPALIARLAERLGVTGTTGASP